MTGAAPRCPACGSTRGVVHVHGHGQCAACGVNVDPCCAGANPGQEAHRTAGHTADPGPQLFERLFARLGGLHATVTTPSLLQAIVDAQDCDLDEARLLLEAGERVGHLQRAGAACHRLRDARR